ncbi:hypothetical protein Agabi119p4_6123 [Agaricus bisporus var. burnettii]|uniref:Uncharacterized protein n=1 Tax=Agaricus bisporus var. burnettii TaxID=192524 RepID=A0A8H7KGC7_AGABI|nr:hypothetical protein Agabi119p4_6123 [Agaricus bisporus var. burnettii]
MTTQMRYNRASSTSVANQGWDQAPTRQALPTYGELEDIVLMATNRPALHNRRSAIHGPVNGPPVWDTPCAPLMRTIPLPSVTEELEELPQMSTPAGAVCPIQGLGNQDPIAIRRSLEHPPALMMRTIAPPPVGDALPDTRIASPALRHRADDREEWHLKAELRYHDSIRPVVKPVLSDMLPYPGHRWGALELDESCVGDLNIHFAYSMAPATDLPLTRMRLLRPFGGKLVVTPTRGNQYVSVGDIQNTVVAWMRWEQPHLQDEGLRLTRREVARAQDNTTVRVEVWVWRGLTKVRGETDLWEIHL